MSLLGRFKKGFAMPKISLPGRKKVEMRTATDGVSIQGLKESYSVIEEYDLNNPFALVKIANAPELGEGNHYFVQESVMNAEESGVYTKVVKILSKELDPPKDEDINPESYVREQAKGLVERYSRSLKEVTNESMDKIMYYVVRNIAGYGPLHVMIQDPNIEDISLNGLNNPIYVWHRKYESIPSNTSFVDPQVANDFIVKLAHRSGKHISSAQPVIDAMLPEKHRLAATFMKEVSTKGSTFCIRKFRADPFSIIDLITLGTLDERTAAYLWYILERKMSFMIIGGTGSGKTTLLNSILSLMAQNLKIVTVEEIPELNPPLSNWAQLISRQSFYFGSATTAPINLFDLVRLSLRYRPEYIIVGEVRGEEAYVLFQALATGHGGLCTMHADSLDHVVKRLTSPPMNVSPVYIPLMNCAIHIDRVDLPVERAGLRYGRRVRSILEVEDFERYREVATWNPRKDTFDESFRDSLLLRRIADKSGISIKETLKELNARELYLKGVVKSGIREQKYVAEKILSYDATGKAAA